MVGTRTVRFFFFLDALAGALCLNNKSRVSNNFSEIKAAVQKWTYLRPIPIDKLTRKIF